MYAHYDKSELDAFLARLEDAADAGLAEAVDADLMIDIEMIRQLRRLVVAATPGILKTC